LTFPDFKSRARAHQIRYRREILNTEAYDTYFTWLSDDDAEAGLNLYTAWPGLLDHAEKRYDFYTKIKTVKNMYKDMLRSEHIPFNLFIPLKPEYGQGQTLAFWQTLLPDLGIQKITDVKVEWVWPVDISRLLDDHTSFDAYLAYENSSGESCGIGIEVKYTEKSYPYGRTEKKRMFKQLESSRYYKATIDSNLCKPEAIPELRKPMLKQFWRNHLLGEKARQIKLVKRFDSLHIYPSGNTYQDKACESYKKQLTPEGTRRFHPITYESFLQVGRDVFADNPQRLKWLDYLDKRYIVTT
jgi:hypothetical protein